MLECENVYAWIVEGEDGFCAARLDDGWYPLVVARLSNAERARDLVRDVAKAGGKPIKLVRFARAEVMETIEP